MRPEQVHVAAGDAPGVAVDDRRPAVLDIEYVLTNLTPMIRGLIRKMQWATRASPGEEEDIFSGLVLRLITPSPTLGTTVLQRYEPSKCVASTYIGQIVINFMREQMRHGSRLKRQNVYTESELLDEGVFLSASGGDSAYNNDFLERAQALHVTESDDDLMDDVVEARLLRARLIKAITHPKYQAYHSVSSQGYPRSTANIALCMVLYDMGVAEVATYLEISPSEVRRRLRKLQMDAALRALVAA